MLLHIKADAIYLRTEQPYNMRVEPQARTAYSVWRGSCCMMGCPRCGSTVFSQVSSSLDRSPDRAQTHNACATSISAATLPRMRGPCAGDKPSTAFDHRIQAEHFVERACEASAASSFKWGAAAPVLSTSALKSEDGFESRVWGSSCSLRKPASNSITCNQWAG